MRVCPQCEASYGPEFKTCPKHGEELIEVPDERDNFVVDRDSLQRLQPVEANNARYTIVGKIGEGGWGGVYRAHQHSTKRDIALKVLRKEVASDHQAQRRFHREAEAISQLKHPNTVTIFDFGETKDGLLFIAMEYVEGRSLEETIRCDGPLDSMRAVRVARQVALSLSEAHAKGIIHRDIKPHNVMLTNLDDGREFVKVLDFGVAKLVTSEARLTATGSTFGTPEYMSPEQVQSRDIDHRSDLYSLGVLLYEMLTGKPPFTGKSAVTIALSHVRDRPPALEPSDDLPKTLRRVLKRLLAKYPDERFDTARDVAEELALVEHELNNTRPVPYRLGTQAMRQVAGAVAANWLAVMTVLAVVCVVVVALLVVRERLLKRGEGTATIATADSHSLPPRTALSMAGEAVSQVAGQADVITIPGVPEPLADTVNEVAGKEGVVVDSREPPDVVSNFMPAGRPGPDVAAQPDVRAARPDIQAMPRPTHIVITVTSNEKNATVATKDNPRCATPCKLRGLPGESMRVRVRASGHRYRSRTILFDRPRTEEVNFDPASLSDRDELKNGTGLVEDDGLK